MLIVRSARADELDALMDLARLSGLGFTSLPEDRDYLASRLAASVESFQGDRAEGQPERFFLMLEDTATGDVVGCASVKSSIGLDRPFFNFRIMTIAQASAEAERRFDMDALVLVNDFAGSTEVGSLFIKKEARGGGAGRLIAQARYLLMAAAPERFGDRVLAELRGVIDETGRSPFWDHLGKTFFQMSFAEADTLSSLTDSQFILDLMPKFPIYVDLLNPEARAVIGQTHPDGAGARRLLEWEGFRYDRVIDIFDAGPLVSAPRDSIRTISESTARTVEVGPTGDGGASCLITNDRIDGYRCTRARASLTPDRVLIDREVSRALQLEAGDTARVWREQ